MLIVRKVMPFEYSKYKKHLLALDVQSKYLRFGFPASDLYINKFVDSIIKDSDRHVLFCIETEDLEFAAVGHVAFDDKMELAFSVLSNYQGQGMGSALMKRIIQWCRTNGMLKGCMVCLPTNQVIKHLCNKFGIKMQSIDGETLADIELDSAEMGTYIVETTDANVAAMDYVGKRLFKNWINPSISS
jgi:GNAT superfamily N-acetyltransferase